MCGCGDEGDRDYNYLRVETTDLTAVENVDTIYEVGDTLFIKTKIPFQLTTVSLENVDLDEFEIGDFGVGFNLLLLRETGFGTLGTVPLNDEFLVQDIGNTDAVEESINVYCERTSNGFENRFGIVLNESGTYQISTRRDATVLPIRYFVDVIAGDTRIDINAYLSQSSANGNFTFKVE